MVQTGRAFRPGGGGGNLILPTGRIAMAADTPEVLVKATHCGKWLWFDNVREPPLGIGADVAHKLPENPVVGDPYFFFCVNRTTSFHEGDSPYAVHLRPNTGQSILMPSQVVAPGQFVDLDHSGLLVCANLLIVVCSAANTWMCVDATASTIGTD
jgi:hypothetical protein